MEKDQFKDHLIAKTGLFQIQKTHAPDFVESLHNKISPFPKVVALGVPQVLEKSRQAYTDLMETISSIDG